MSELWAKAMEASQEARMLFQAGLHGGAASRAYYAMFNGARALLVEQAGVSVESIKRHGTIIRLFTEHFIKPGRLDPELGRMLGRAAETRKTADYDDAPVEQHEMNELLDAMERFLAAAAALRTGG